MNISIFMLSYIGIDKLKMLYPVGLGRLATLQGEFDIQSEASHLFSRIFFFFFNSHLSRCVFVAYSLIRRNGEKVPNVKRCQISLNYSNFLGKC